MQAGLPRRREPAYPPSGWQLAGFAWRQGRLVLVKGISASLESVPHFVSTCPKRNDCKQRKQREYTILWQVILFHWPQLAFYATPRGWQCRELDVMAGKCVSLQGQTGPCAVETAQRAGNRPFCGTQPEYRALRSCGCLRAICRTKAHRVRRKNPLQVSRGCGFKRYSLRGSVAIRSA